MIGRVTIRTRASYVTHAARIVLVAVAPFAMGCQGLRGPIGERREMPPERGGVMQLATYADVRTLDPALAFDTASSAVTQLVFAGLVDYGTTGHIEPQLAERFTVSEDGKRYEFKLREGIRFHDGEELVADDVKRSIERTLRHDTPCPQPSFYASIRGYDAFHEGTRDVAGKRVFAPELEGVGVDGRYLVHIELSTPDATFLPALTLPLLAPVCRSAGTTYARDWASHACGAGPFKLRDWQSSREIVLTRHEGYFEPGKPYLDEIHWFLLMPQLSQRFKFERGQLDLIGEFTFADHIAYRADARWRPYEFIEPAKAVMGIFLNTEMKPFNDVEMRRAVASAIDWEQIASVRPGLYLRASRMVPPAIAGPGHEREDKSFVGQKHDVAAALQHMRNAGYPYDPVTRRGGYPTTLRYLGQAGSAGELMPQIVQQQLATVGIRMDMKMVSWPTFLAESSKRGGAQLGYAGWSMDFPDASDFFEPILASSAIQEEETQNAAFYSNPELDALLKKAHSETDEAERARLYHRCEEIVRDDVPWAIGLNQTKRQLVQPYVHNYTVNTSHEYDVREVFIDAAQRQTSSLGRRTSRVLALIRPWGRP